MAADAEALYDQYLDASLLGEPEDPAAFFARYPGVDEHGRERIETLFQVLTEAERDADDDDDDTPPFERVAGYRLLRRIGHSVSRGLERHPPDVWASPWPPQSTVSRMCL